MDFADSVPSLAKPNSLVTWWNGSGTETSIIDLEGIVYEEIDVVPTQNSYYPYSKYYLPKKEF